VAEDGYTGPPIGVDGKAQLKQRVRKFVRQRADQIYQQQVMAWAAANSGDYPTHDEAVRDALDELEVVLRSLGRWAMVDSDRLPFGWPRRRYDDGLTNWERDILGE
jgi:hypothetical protein